MKKKEGLRIGELAKRAGVTPRTIRFYVEERLLPGPLYTNKNIAYYGEDLVEKIQAIKTAQKKSFLPLIVIAKILKNNGYDYSALTAPEVVEILNKDQGGMNKINRWIGQKNLNKNENDDFTFRDSKKYSTDSNKAHSFTTDPVLLNFISALNRASDSWDELVKAFRALEKTVGETVDMEFQNLSGRLIKGAENGFGQLLKMEEETVSKFIKTIKQKQLEKVSSRYKRYLDNAYRASFDEGFAVPAEVIVDEMVELENRLNHREVNVRILNDLSIGHSCVGEFDKALRCLNKVLKKDPNNLETRVRWFWHKRFSGRKGEAERLKEQLKQLVDEYPEFAFGRAFFAMWHFTDVLAYDDHGQIEKEMNFLTDEFEKAIGGQTLDLHEWAIVRYFKGKVLTSLQSPENLIEEGIEAFQEVLRVKKDLDKIYKNRMAFYPKWLWPNFYFFFGSACLRVGRLDDAIKVFDKAREFKMMPPFEERLEQYMKKALSLKNINQTGSLFECG